MTGSEIQFDLQLGIESLAYLSDHTIRGTVVLPATTYIEMALATSGEVLGTPAQAIHNIAFHQALTLAPDQYSELQVVLEQTAPQQATFWIFSRSSEHAPQALHTSGTLAVAAATEAPSLDLAEIRTRCQTAIDAAAHYAAMQQRGIAYGPMFQAVEQIRRQHGEALAQIQLPTALLEEADVYHLHPVLLDASFQIVAAARSAEATAERLLPVGVRALQSYAPLPSRLWAHARLTAGAEPGAERVEADVLLCDDQGQVMVAVSGLRLQRIADTQPRVAAQPAADVAPAASLQHSAATQQLAAIWAEVLQIATIDPHDNFFELGGDSLMATQIAAKAQRGGISFTPQFLFEHPTIAQLLIALDPTQEISNV